MMDHRGLRKQGGSSQMRKGERSHLYMLFGVLEKCVVPEGGERVICCRQIRGEGVYWPKRTLGTGDR